MNPDDPHPASPATPGALAAGERTGPGFEGLRCPACGAHFRARLDRPGDRFRCPCGREFPVSGLGGRPAGTEARGPGITPATLMVHAGTLRGQPPTSGETPGLEGQAALAKAAAAGGPATIESPGEAASPPPEAVPSGPPAVRFGKYEILGEVARGGMGVVYRARQAGLKREVALKMLLAGEGAGEDQIRRFLREAESAARLSHPNIVPIYDVGVEDGKHYYAMEFIHGESVAQIIDRMGGIPPRQALKIARETALALQYAHEQGIIHRDIKPANILIAPREAKSGAEPARTGESMAFASGAASSYRAMLADFGLAKDLSGENALTVSGAALGTPVYMSPEQADGDLKNVGPRSDVYSLGAVLYEMVTGQEPFEGASVAQVLAKVISQDPVPPRKRVPSLHRDVETIILKAMDKEAVRRYPSAQALADDIDRYLKGEAIQARPASIVYRTGKFVRRNKAVAAAAVLVPLILAAAAVFAWIDAGTRAGETHRKALGLVEEGRRLLANRKTEDAEKAFESALVLVPGLEPARQGVREARLGRLLENARDLIKEKNYKAAGFLLQEALGISPDDPESLRLLRIQKGTAALEVSADADEEGLEAFFAPAEPGIPWGQDTLPDLAAALHAGILEALGPLPFGPADRPFGDGWLVLARGGRIVSSLFLRISREAQVTVKRKRIRVQAPERVPSGGAPPPRMIASSITAALMTATPGTVIEVGPGVYRENLQISKPGITIRAVPGAKVEVGIREQGPALLADQAPGLRIEGLTFHSDVEGVIQLSNCPFAALVGNTVSGGTLEVVSLTNCPGSLVLGNEIRDGKGPGLALRDCLGSIAAGNHVHHVGWYAIGGGSGAFTAARNRVHDSSRCGFFCNEVEGIEVLENVFSKNPQWGICIAERSKDIVVRGNLVFDTVYAGEGQFARGIQYGSNQGGLMAHNTIYNSTVGVFLQAAPGLVCRDNLVAGNDEGIRWTESGPVDSCCFFGNKSFGRTGKQLLRDPKELRDVLAAAGIPGMDRILLEDPRFVDPAGGVFELGPESPCRGAASDGGDIGADWKVLLDVLEGKWERGAWLRALLARRLASIADREEAKSPALAAAALRKALALTLGDAALKARLAALPARKGPSRDD